MIDFIKIIILLLALFLIVYPMLPIKMKIKALSPIAASKFEHPHLRKNLIFVVLAVLNLVFFMLLYNVIENVVNTILNIPFIGSLISKTAQSANSNVKYAVFGVITVLGNLIMIYVYVILKTFIKSIISFGDKIKNKKSKNGEGPAVEEETEEPVEEKNGVADEHIPVLEHIRKKVKQQQEEDEKEVKYGFIAKTCFEGNEYQYAKPGILRVVNIIQTFIYVTIAVFAIIIGCIFASVLFPLPKVFYDIFINVLKIEQWYLYPFLSIIILQELCNTFKTAPKPIEEPEKVSEQDEKRITENKIALRNLATDLKKNFDEDHKLRFYPSRKDPNKTFEYEFTNSPYKGALEYIKNTYCGDNATACVSYLECLDAMFNDEHVYFCGSFYSEISEYVMAYTYTRLLSGARVIFVVSDKKKRESLRKYILKRLSKITGTTEEVSWRVYTSEDRLDQADVLIASPDDFKDDNIVENFPDFFEEVCNAIFIDADKVVSLESYLCPVVAIRLLKATANRIKFAFFTQDLIRGFAQSSLPKLFCIDKVLTFSSAEDNESVEYTLWNRESSKNRIYYKNGQKLMTLEGIIANRAYKYGIDGIRVMTSSPIDHAERKILAEHGVEINEFYKETPNINYMIYSDERCNLAAAIYACTRFRGEKNSVAQIISKPYLLREYFIDKTTKENFIKRSSFIQPRITEHAKKEKLSLLKIFCKAANTEGISINDFEKEIKSVIRLSRIRGDVPLCKFCASSKFSDLTNLPLRDLAAYLIAALCDNYDTPKEKSYGNKAKDYYILVDHINHELYSLTKEKFIIFKKTKEVFERVFACNERVQLRLNDNNIGYLDTFPTRVPLEYVVGQSIVYDNVEYEIEQISKDGKTIFLRRENVTFKNCLDTVFLRRYKINSTEKISQDGVLCNSKSLLKEIKVTVEKAEFVGETYGFYNLMSNNQSLNLIAGVEGNPHIERSVVESNNRNLTDGRLLHVTLTTAMECTDGMRLLCSAVFNEFIKTIFPKAYRCIAITPILENPLEFSKDVEAQTTVDKIKTLYPYITADSTNAVETNKNLMQFYFINDCVEDVGVIDWFYDKLANYMQEFLINAYSYFYWLNSRPELQHYIYFGDEKICECYDLEGCCKLFEGYNLVISEDGKTDYNTAGEYEAEEELRCSFCHKIMESGRYSFYDKSKTKYICADCMDIVGDEDQLAEIHGEIKKYLATNYPELSFGFAEVQFVEKDSEAKELNEWYFKFDPDQRKIIVGYELPEKNLKIAILCGMITMWQYDNDLMTEYSLAQLNYEQLKFLRHIGKDSIADYIYENLEESRRYNVDEIAEAIDNNTKVGEEGEEAIDPHYNSFSFMREKGEELRDLEDDVEYEDIEGEDYSDLLYEPERTPRFWKRYFRLNEEDEDKNSPVTEDFEDGGDASDEELVDGDESPVEGENEEQNGGDDLKPNSCMKGSFNFLPNSPLGGSEDDEALDDEEVLDDETEDDIIDEGEDDLSLDDDLAIDDGVDDEELLDDETEDDLGADPFDIGDESVSEEETLLDEESDEGDDSLDIGEEDDEELLDEELDEDLGDEDDVADTSKNQKASKDQAKKLEKERLKKLKKQEKLFLKGQKKSIGLKKVPYDPEEDTNPRIKLYNEIVRHAYNYSEGPISREGVSDKQLGVILSCALHDYPELFWVENAWSYNDTTMNLSFRCKTPSGVLDVKQINKKLKELRDGAKFFTKGITKKTPPYEALMTIYKRLILTLDYDTKGLNARIDVDRTKDDRIRSLHSAIVVHKTVCAGYAVAMQYLLQSVGIPCGYVVSEFRAKSGHAFNVVKIGKFCYYLDATWGDSSNTLLGDKNNDIIKYSYCCVPYSDFILVDEANKHNHIPNKELYPWFKKELQSTGYEYYRYNKAFISRYNEDDLVSIFAGCASRYNPKEDGRFTISFRCSGKELAKQLSGMILNGSYYNRIVKKAQETLGKNKNAKKWLDLPTEGVQIDDANVVMIVYKRKTKK